MNPPRVIDGYELRAELARGAQGVVYRAFDPRLRREVALKLLSDPRAGPALTRFQREAALAARLRHPHVVTLHAAGTWQGLSYLVMDLVEGESLGRRLERERRLAPREAARIALRLAEALEAAHGLGILHRDVKPENVLVGSDGEPRLTDFGLARDLFAEQSLTAEGLALGTPAFWAPEQARGERALLGPHTDVYGLGALLFTLLSGAAPNSGSTLRELERTLERPPQAPSTLTPGLDPALDAIVLRCLARRPEERYPSAGALAAALREWLTGPPLALAAPAPAGEGELALRLAALLLSLGLAVGAAPLFLAWRRERGRVAQLAAELARVGSQRLALERSLAAAHPAAPAPSAGALPAQALEALREGWSAAGREDVAAASAHAQRAMQAAPRWGEPWALLARARLLVQDAGAVEACQEALRRDPGSVLALTLRGLAEARVLRRPEAARATWAEVRALATDDPRALGFRALLAMDQGDGGAALKDVDRALELDPTDHELWGNRAAIRSRQGDARGALADYRQALLVGPPRVNYLLGLGEVALRVGELETARASYQRAREAGESVGVLVGLGNVAMVEQEHAVALDLFTRAQALGPDQPGPRMGRVQMLHALGRRDEARAELEALRRTHPAQAGQLEERLR